MPKTKDEEYRLIIRDYSTDLQDAVNMALSEGWRLVGGVSMAVVRRTWTNHRNGDEEGETEWAYAQAMSRHHVTPTESEQNA